VSRSVMRKLIFVASLILSSVSPGMNAAEHWIRLTTPHFEMYTTNGEKQGTAALNVFEQVRYFFGENSKWKAAPSTPVRIIAFRSEKEFKPYRFNEGSFAYYFRSRKADCVVMQDIGPEHYQAVIHEYTHLIVEHDGLKLPVWLNEGLADVYSSLEPRGNQALVGRALQGREAMLVNQRWLDLNVLFGASLGSPYYNEKDKMSIFYAQSWALTHMLILSEAYGPGFSKFVAAAAAGRPVADSLQSIYGKTPSQVTRDLHAYINRSSLRAAVYDIKLNKADLEPDVSEPSELAVDLALADLLASQKKTQAEAAERLAELATAHPESGDVQESLGYLALQQGNHAKASECFKRALDKGARNAEMLSDYAQLLHESGASAQQMLPVLRQIVELKPNDQDAWLNLGATAASAGQYGVGLEALSHIKTVNADQAYALFSTKAYCLLQLKAPKPAREMAEKAKQYAKTLDQEGQASAFLRHLDSLERQDAVQSLAKTDSLVRPVEEAPRADQPMILKRNATRELSRDEPTVRWSADLQHVEAVAKFFDCNSKIHQLRVNVDSKEMVFELDKPKEVIVRNMNNGFLDLQCGPQKPFRVGVFYVPSLQGAGADGVVRELVF
jgi:tetratricopeptide (TPR) repeat protein